MTRAGTRSHLIGTTLLALALALASPGAARAADPPLAQHPEVAAALAVLDAWIQATVNDRELPGLSIGIVHDQALVWAKGYGFADVERKVPATPATAYRIASITKLFTATAIMQLRDAGKLRLDDPVETHLPWFRVRNMHPHGPAITIRHLLTHTSGLPRESPVPYWNDLRFPSRDEVIRLLATQETVFAAETQWKYSNLAYAIAGEIVAAVAGEPYPQYVAARILEPLGMTTTRVVPEPAMPDLAAGYGRRVSGAARDVAGFTDAAGLMPAASLASTVEDLARFAALQLRDGPAGGAQVLKGSTLREMHRVQWLRPDWKSGQGLGFAVRRVGEQMRIGHGGSLRGYRTQLEIAPAAKLAVIVLTNANDERPLRYADQAFTIVGPAIARATETPRPAPKTDPEWDAYAGTYGRPFGADVQVMALNGQLTLVIPDAENPWESRVTLRPVAANTFRMIGGASAGELLRFDLGPSGRATGFTAGNTGFVRK